MSGTAPIRSSSRSPLLNDLSSRKGSPSDDVKEQTSKRQKVQSPIFSSISSTDDSFWFIGRVLDRTLPIIKQYPNVQTVDIAGSKQLTTIDCLQHQSITALNISKCYSISSESLEKTIPSLSKLQTLIATHAKITGKMLKDLSKNKTITCLDISYCPLSSRDTRYLKSFPQLVSLKAVGSITKVQAQTFTALSSLTQLDLRGNTSITDGILDNVTWRIRILDVSHTPISSNCLARNLCTYFDIVEFYGENTKFDGLCLMALCAQTNLKILSASSCEKISEESFADHLGKFASLEEVYLANTNIGQAGLEALVTENLKVLSLSHCKKIPKESFATYPNKFPCLKKLHLSNTNIDRSGLENLILEAIPWSLTELDISFCLNLRPEDYLAVNLLPDLQLLIIDNTVPEETLQKLSKVNQKLKFRRLEFNPYSSP